MATKEELEKAGRQQQADAFLFSAVDFIEAQARGESLGHCEEGFIRKVNVMIDGTDYKVIKGFLSISAPANEHLLEVCGWEWTEEELEEDFADRDPVPTGEALCAWAHRVAHDQARFAAHTEAVALEN